MIGVGVIKIHAVEIVVVDKESTVKRAFGVKTLLLADDKTHALFEQFRKRDFYHNICPCRVFSRFHFEAMFSCDARFICDLIDTIALGADVDNFATAGYFWHIAAFYCEFYVLAHKDGVVFRFYINIVLVLGQLCEEIVVSRVTEDLPVQCVAFPFSRNLRMKRTDILSF